MSCDLDSDTLADNVGELVNKTKLIVDRLRLAIIHQDNVTKDCFETTPTELSEAVESIKKTYSKLEQEREVIAKEVKDGENRLNNILQEYQDAVEENALLKEAEHGLLDQNNGLDDFGKTASELQDLLQTYKKITGVRFDYTVSNDVITGYIGIPGNKASNSTLIPFEIDESNSNKKFLWQKISEACEEITNNSS